MTPGGRVQAAIEILDAVLARRPGGSGTPADAVVAGYTRKRRYIGSKDRRAIAGLVWQALRYRGRALWASGWESLTGRELAIAALAGASGRSDAGIAADFHGSGYAPRSLDAAEVRTCRCGARGRRAAALGCSPTCRPGWPGRLHPCSATGCPDGLAGARRGGPRDLAGQHAEGRPANSCPRRAAGRRRRCRADGAEPARDPVAVPGTNLARLPAMRDGWLESQDEGSQIAAALVAAGPGMQVLDYCAGGGGKALALAAAMANDGQDRGDGYRRRPTGVASPPGGARRRDDISNAGKSSRAPRWKPRHSTGCSWTRRGRRQRRLAAPARSARGASIPRATPELQAAQTAILEAAAASVAPGGRLVYVTCSIFPAENDAIVEQFLIANALFRPVAPRR